MVHERSESLLRHRRDGSVGALGRDDDGGASGLDISTPWQGTPKEIGAAVRLILENRDSVVNSLGHEATHLRTMAERVGAVAKSLREMERCTIPVAPSDGPMAADEPPPGETGARPPAR